MRLDKTKMEIKILYITIEASQKLHFELNIFKLYLGIKF
jgi:hypothetical protein